MSRKRPWAVLALVFLFTGCVGYTLVEGGKRLELGEGIAVEPGRAWNRLALQGRYEYWTLDGLHLQRLLFVKGVEDGEAIVPVRSELQDKEEGVPTFRKGMSFLEVRELVEATLARSNAQRVAVTEFVPAKFGGKDGFRFDFTYDTAEGLHMLGKSSGTIFQDRLYMVIYVGTKLHFYGRGQKDVDRILGSLRFI